MSSLLVPAINTLSPWIDPALAYYELANSKVHASHERRCSLSCGQARSASLASREFNVLLPDLPRHYSTLSDPSLYTARLQVEMSAFAYPSYGVIHGFSHLQFLPPTRHMKVDIRPSLSAPSWCLFDELSINGQVNFGQSKLPAGITVYSIICVSYSRCGLNYGTALLFTGGFNSHRHCRC